MTIFIENYPFSLIVSFNLMIIRLASCFDEIGLFFKKKLVISTFSEFYYLLIYFGSILVLYEITSEFYGQKKLQKRKVRFGFHVTIVIKYYILYTIIQKYSKNFYFCRLNSKIHQIS